MNVKEIIAELKKGKQVVIAAADSFEFMREVVRHGMTTSGIRMKFQHGRCVMKLDRF